MCPRSVPNLPWIHREAAEGCLHEQEFLAPLSAEDQRELSRHMEMVREDERKLIAREIHDELGQQLTALRLGLMRLKMDVTAHLPDQGPAFDQLSAMLGNTITLSRNMVSKLRPAALDMGLETALEWLVEQFSQINDIPCRLIQHCHGLELDDYTSIALFRIAQEALNNITKHANATHVRIVLHKTEDPLILLCIRDDGKGFDIHQKAQNSYGLIGIRERVNALNGQLYLFSAEGQGTHLEVQLPLQQQMPSAEGSNT